MNIQRLKTSINIISILCIFCTIESCSTSNNSQRIKYVAKGIEIVNNDYYFSEEGDIKLGERRYSLRSKIKYESDGYVSSLLVYYPEGVLSYTKKELLNDPAILNNLGYEFKNKYTYADGQLKKSSKLENITTKKIGNVLIAKIDGKVILYYLE